MKTENTDLCGLEIQRVPGVIIITAGDALDGVPAPLIALFHDLGISDATVRSVLLEGGLPNE